MNPKKIASIIVLIAGVLLIALVVENLGDKTYQRNEYAQPISTEKILTEEEKFALERELYEAKVNASWQATKLGILRRASAPDPMRINSKRDVVEKTKISLNKIINDSHKVAKNAVKKTNIPFVQAKTEIANHKKSIDSLLVQWENEINSGNPPSSSDVNDYLDSVTDYLNEVKEILNSISPEDSGLTQEEINEYIEDIEESLTEIENTIDNLSEIQSDLDQAEDGLFAEENVGNQEAINDQVQEVIDSQAEIADLEEQLEEGTQEAQTQNQGQTSPPSPQDIYIQETGITDPNVKIILPFDPSKPHLLQD